MLYSDRKKQKLFYFGHRGAPELARENTLESIVMAIDLGCDGIEIDIQMTLDNRLILFHDSYIINNNKKHKISNLRYQEINNILSQQDIPAAALFDDFIYMIRKYPHIVFNIEIKSQRFINSFIVKKLHSKISGDSSLVERCIISSFNILIMCQCKFLFDRNALGLIICSNRAFGGFTNIINKILVMVLNPRFLHLSKAFLDNNIIRWGRSRKMFIHLYTINTKDILEKCIANQIDGVFTDNHRFYSSLDSEKHLNHQ